MEKICVVHLARAKNGLGPFESFLRTYQKYRAGVAHDLLVVYKGFQNEAAAARWEKAAGGFRHNALFVPDWGFDLRAFRVAAERSEHRHLFFVNSFSEILADEWLAKPYALMQEEGNGIIGATGSWESMYTNALNHINQCHSLVARVTGLLRLKACQFFFDPFPNFHVRSNAFMMPRKLMLEVWPRYVLSKRHAYRFENGKDGLTKRIRRGGLRPLVVGKDGRGFEMIDWHNSNTFRTANQENLLIADNQTRFYQQADPQLRRKLTASAWGGNASLLS